MPTSPVVHGGEPTPAGRTPRPGTRGGLGGATILAVAAAVPVAVLVLQRAWVSDDALITLRYVHNTLQGLGPVYNVGERVQGYTHPLWFLLLLVGGHVHADLYEVAIGLGVLLTGVLAGLLGWVVARERPGGWETPVTVVAAALLLLASSDTWRSFQTGGLENPLAHLLIVLLTVELLGRATVRSERVVLLAGMICLTRPDLLFLVTPAVVASLIAPTHRIPWPRVALAAAPAAAWIAFAWTFYGTPVPNTAAAKLGIFASRGAAVRQGLTYLLDWVLLEPVVVVAVVLGAWTLARRAEGWGGPALAAGLVAQALWVIWIGGDFMRGRMFLPVLTGAVAGAALVLARSAGARQGRNAGRVAGATVVLGVIAAEALAPRPVPGTNGVGIADEWLSYRDYHLDHVRRVGHLGDPERHELAVALDGWVRACGPLTLHSDRPAYFGYVVGPDLTMIDVLGLTDAFVAHLPSELLLEHTPRPGHPYKRIPRAYLWERRDAALVEGWEAAIRERDCTVALRAAAPPRPGGYWVPDVPRYMEGP